MKFRLSPYIKTTYFLNAVMRDETQVLKRVKYAIEPYNTYESEDYKDKTPTIDDLINQEYAYIPYTKATLDTIKNLGAEYSLHGCRGCSGKLSQINLKVFEVIE